MAIQYEVELQRSEQGSYQKGGNRDSLRQSFSIDYKVTVSDPADPGFDGTTVDAFDVMAISQLPKVNFSTYFRNGKIIPYLVCSSKSAQRNESNRKIWTVSTQYDTGDSQQQEQEPQDPPATLAEYLPKIEREFGEYQQVRLNDVDDKSYKTPTGNLWTDPLILSEGDITIRVTQYQATATDDDLVDKLFKCNDATWRGKQAYAWLVTGVAVTPVTVELSGGSTGAYQVTYTIKYSPAVFGWEKDIAQVDTHFYGTASDATTKTPFTDKEVGTFTTGDVDLDGTKDPAVTVYDQWRPFKTIDFNSFLHPSAGIA